MEDLTGIGMKTLVERREFKRVPRSPDDAGLHIVQIGYDDSVYEPLAASDTVERQVAYGRVMHEQAPGSRLALVSVTSRQGLCGFDVGPVSFVPAHVARQREFGSKLFDVLRRLHRAHRIDVITAQTIQEDGWVALAFGHRHGIPVVGQIHFDLFSQFAREELFGASVLGRLRYRLSLACARLFPAMRVVSEGLRLQLLARGYRGRLEVIPVPVTLADSHRGQAIPIAPRRSADERPVVLFVGRLVAAKNLGEWLELARSILEHCPRARFRIAGDGPLAGPLRERAAALGLADAVSFLGRVPYQELAREYRAAAVLLLTSHYEGFGRVAVEAGRFGVPVVATRVCGLEDIVESGTSGFLHAKTDRAGMAESVVSILKDPALGARLGAAAAQRTQDLFDPAVLTQRWASLLIGMARNNSA